MNLLDRIIDKAKNHKIISIVILLSMLLIGFSEILNSIGVIRVKLFDNERKTITEEILDNSVWLSCADCKDTNSQFTGEEVTFLFYNDGRLDTFFTTHSSYKKDGEKYECRYIPYDIYKIYVRENGRTCIKYNNGKGTCHKKNEYGSWDIENNRLIIRGPAGTQFFKLSLQNSTYGYMEDSVSVNGKERVMSMFRIPMINRGQLWGGCRKADSQG